MLTATNDQKKALRRHKKIHGIDDVRHTLVKGCIDREAYMQFPYDVRVYGLWEALLYAESYETEGKYAPGTAQKALDAAIGCLAQIEARIGG